MKVVTAEQMKRIDTAATKYGMSGFQLMKNAGSCVYEVIAKRFGPPDKKTFLVFCGKGNNGGDGYRIAQLLLEAEAKVRVIALGENKNPNSDAAAMKQHYLDSGGIIENAEDFVSAGLIPNEAIIIDALFGTGLKGAITGFAAETIRLINNSDVPVVSVDIPSGIDTDTGQILGIAVRSVITVTFAFYKPAHFLMPASQYCGVVILQDIGIPERSAESEKLFMTLFDQSQADIVIPKYRKNEHKGSCGKLLVIGGSLTMGGAPVLASGAAMRCGCGIVKLMVPHAIWQSVSAKTLEIMTIPMEDTLDGAFSKNIVDSLLCGMDYFDAVVIGCGMSVCEDTEEILTEILKHCTIPMVIDADGLNVLSKNMECLKHKKCPVILTPHIVEMARMTQLSPSEIKADRINAVIKFAAKYDITVVLKGPNSLTASSDGRIYINTSGNPGMATAGSGDVLAGVIGAFAARDINPFEAAAAGVYIHGYAGDLAAEELSQYGMIASDIIAQIPKALKRYDYRIEA